MYKNIRFAQLLVLLALLIPSGVAQQFDPSLYAGMR